MTLVPFAWAGGCAATDGGRGASADGGTESAGTDGTPSGGGDADESENGGFGPEETFELRLNEETPPPLMLSMTREEVAELFGDTADEVLLLELDSTVLLVNTLNEVKSACGSGWMLDNEDPQHNCALTELGQGFAGPDGTWQTSPEYALVRVMTMTPANAVVDGTSSESLRSLADALDIGGGYSEILSDALGIARTDAVVSTAALASALQANFVASHPAVGEGALLRFYLADALSDLSTMTDRYGPEGEHPGVVDPTFEVNGEVFGPDFRMNAVADSNLRLVDGLDADGGKGFLSVIADTTGPGFDDELEFDFNDPDRFSLQGVIDDLTINMRFKLYEDGSFVLSCLGANPCHDNLPGAPTSPVSVWARDPWSIEYNIAAAAYADYHDRTFLGSYLFGLAEVLIGQLGNPAGWIQYDVPLNIGSPPDDQYVWETILEIAQVALHNTPFSALPEGAVDAAFTVRDIPVGLTGAEASDAVRPYLQDQAAALSDFILGDYKKNNDPVDFFFRRGADGERYLFFAGTQELEEGEPYDFARPGFFSSASLAEETKVSNLVIAGTLDTEHEKLQLGADETVVYYEDDAGIVWRARIESAAADGSEILVHMAREE